MRLGRRPNEEKSALSDKMPVSEHAVVSSSGPFLVLGAGQGSRHSPRQHIEDGGRGKSSAVVLLGSTTERGVRELGLRTQALASGGRDGFGAGVHRQAPDRYRSRAA